MNCSGFDFEMRRDEFGVFVAHIIAPKNSKCDSKVLQIQNVPIQAAKLDEKTNRYYFTMTWYHCITFEELAQLSEPDSMWDNVELYTQAIAKKVAKFDDVLEEVRNVIENILMPIHKGEITL